MDQRISELTPISSGSINSTGSLIELVQGINNYKTTPKDFVQSTLPIPIDSLVIIASGSSTTASNVGTGDGEVYKEKVGNDLRFKTIKAGTNITVSNDTNEITINSTASGSSTASNVGTGEGEVYKEKVGNDLRFRTIKAGTNITVTNDSNEITINSTASGSTSGSLPSLKSFVLSEDMEVRDLAVLQTNGQIRKVEYSWVGLEYIFNENSTGYTSVGTLSDTKFIVGYIDTTTGFPFVKIGEIGTGNSITFGPSFLVNPSVEVGCTVASVSSSKFVVLYGDYSKIGVISGENITFGEDYLHNHTGVVGVTVLDSTRFAVYSRAVKSGSVSVGTITETTIIYGDFYVYTSDQYASYYGLSACSLSDSIIAIFNGYSYLSSAKNYVYIGNVSGSVVSFGSANIFTPSPQSRELHITSLDSSKIVIYYEDQSDSQLKTRVGTVLGTNVSFGNENIVLSTGVISASTQLATIDSSTIVVLYNSTGPVARRKIGTVSGNTITYNDPVTFNLGGGYANNISICVFDNGTFLVAFDDNGNSNYGTAILGAGSLGSLVTDKILGILQASGSMGESKPVAIFGDISAVHSELIPSYYYYYDIINKNDVTLTDNNFLAGFALSSTELKIVSY